MRILTFNMIRCNSVYIELFEVRFIQNNIGIESMCFEMFDTLHSTVSIVVVIGIGQSGDSTIFEIFCRCYEFMFLAVRDT